MKKLIFIILLFLTYSFNSFADSPSFIDFSKVLNNSKPGAEFQKNIKARIKKDTEKFKKLNDNIRKEEADIISQKKALKPEDYKIKVQALRSKVAELQKNKQTSFNNIAKSRANARNELIKAVNPIVKTYMEKNNIRIVVDKSAIVLGDTTLEITDQIILILNKELPKLKIN